MVEKSMKDSIYSYCFVFIIFLNGRLEVSFWMMNEIGVPMLRNIVYRKSYLFYFNIFELIYWWDNILSSPLKKRKYFHHIFILFFILT